MSEVTLKFVGDIMLGELLQNINRGVKSKIEKGVDPFKYINEILIKSDLVIGNLECVLSDKSCLQEPFSKALRANQEYAKFLSKNNIKLVNLANNHTRDHGNEAFITTLDVLSMYKINHFGYSIDYDFQTNPTIIQIKNVRLGFLGYNLANLSDDELYAQRDKIIQVIIKSRKNVDLLILSLHWGLEYVNIPSIPYTTLAKDFLDAGVDIIHGHHTHQLQGVVTKNNKIIAFSLGNFIFDDHLQKKNRYTAILEVKIDTLERKIKSHNVLLAFINRSFQPIPIRNGKKLLLLEKLDYLADTAYNADGTDARSIYFRAKKNSKEGHLKNKIRIRFKILLHFWTYSKYFITLLMEK